MRVLITGMNGFIGKNLSIRLQEKGIVVVPFTRQHNVADLPKMLIDVDWVFHLAGINRPDNPLEFEIGNNGLTEKLCEAIKAIGKSIPVIYSSSIQAMNDNDYGKSKLASEMILLNFEKETSIPAYIFRLPNVFGKWARPDYNSVVATFCHCIARDLPIYINDPKSTIPLVYVDDLIDDFISLIMDDLHCSNYVSVNNQYEITVGNLAKQIEKFRKSRDNLSIEKVGNGLIRALYSTYVSYLPIEKFTYPLQKHIDERGSFVEMLKTSDAGQISFFTAHPGVTRGGHYHHSKTEKFLVIKGQACFRFRDLLTKEYHEINTSEYQSIVVETIPGWTHDVTNTGTDELICMLWANEVYNESKPDTYMSSI